MERYNLTKYSSKFSETRGSSWFYFKDRVTDIITNLLYVFKLKY